MLFDVFLLSRHKLAAAVLTFGGIIGFVTHPPYWRWILAIDLHYCASVIWQSLMFTVCIVSALRVVSLSRTRTDSEANTVRALIKVF